MSKYNVGDKVRVANENTEQYLPGAPALFAGRVGTVEEVGYAGYDYAVSGVSLFPELFPNLGFNESELEAVNE